MISEALPSALAVVPFTCAVAVASVTLLRLPGRRQSMAQQLVAGLGLALEFLLAAGLLRLASLSTFHALAGVAAIVAARRVMSTGLEFGARAGRRQRVG